MPGPTSDEVQQQEWLSISEAAEYLGVSEPTIYRWMRDGKLSFYKVGDSTRFRSENLDMVVEKHTGAHEADYYGSRCVACGHSRLVRGRVQSTGYVYFKPARTRFLTLHQSLVRVEARVCPRCGFVQMFTDTGLLAHLLRNEDMREGQD
jgi:excisionase family DNA binding protein